MNGWWMVWLVAQREMITRMRTRAYQVSTVLLVVIVVGGISASQWLPDFFEDGPARLGVLPAAAPVREPLREIAATFDEKIELVDLSAETDLEGAMEREDLDAILVEPGRLVFNSDENAVLQAIVAQAAFEAALPARAEALGLSVEQARQLIQPVPVAIDVLSPDLEEDSDTYGIVTLSSFILLIALSQYGQWVLIGVIEEKSNRVVEVLLAVVAPWQLLMGKVLGIMALALAQIGIALGAIAVAMVAIDGASLPDSSGRIIAASVTWLVLGLLFYNFVYAAVGATATRPEEASSATAPIMAPIMLGYFTSISYVPGHPDAIVTRLLSMFPLTSPMMMPARVVAGGVSAIEMVIALALMVVTIIGTIWLAGRIYSGSILRTQRISLLTAIRRLGQ